MGNRLYRAAPLFLLCVFLFHVSGVMSYLLRQGRLSMVPIYDDVVYLVDGLKRLDVLDNQGIWRFLLDFYAHPPHAPLSSLTSTIGLMFSGGEAWGPYLFSAGWIALVLLLGWGALRHASPWVRAGILVAVLASPQFGFVLAEFRPDAVWGLLVGFSVLVAASGSMIWAKPRRLFALGLLFGLAIVSKPTASPGSMATLATAWCVQVCAAMLMDRTWHIVRALRAGGWVVLGAMCMVIPYVVINGAGILDYIRMVMASDSMWRTPGSTWVHMTYYLGRDTGVVALGWIWYSALPLVAATALLITWRKDRQALPTFLSILAAVVGAYLIVTVSAVKSLMIGSILYGSIVAAVVWCLGYLLTRIPVRGWVVSIFGALVFVTQWLPRTGQIHRADPSILAADVANRAVLPGLADVLRARPDASVIVTDPGPAYAGTLSFLTKAQGIYRTFNSGYTVESWEQTWQFATANEVIIINEIGMIGQSLGWTFPSLKFQSRLRDDLLARGEYSGTRAFTDAEGRSVWMFVRKQKR